MAYAVLKKKGWNGKLGGRKMMGITFFQGIVTRTIVLTLLVVVGKSFPQKPNLVILLTDDHGYADLYANLTPDLKASGNYEQVRLSTPNMDLLAESGIMFTDAHSNGNTCAPTRAAIMTGRYTQQEGFWHTPDSRRGLPLSEITLADVLKEGGYTTAMIGKWHLGLAPQYNPRERGFDYYYGFMGHGAHPYYDLRIPSPSGTHNNMFRNYEHIDEGTDNYLTDRIAEETISFIEQNKDKPFFAYVCFNAVHSPMEPPTSGPFSTNSSDKRDQLMGMLGRMDLAIGNIRKSIDDNGLTNNTLVILMSDNGGAGATNADNSPLFGSKGSMWEGGIRVPFIISWPGTLAAGKKFGEMTMGFDIFPTMVAAAGLSMPDDGKVYDGVNLLPFMPTVNAPPPRIGPVHNALYWDQDQGPWAVRVGNWKLVYMKGNIELYNMRTDSLELNNRASSNPDKVAELQDSIDNWRLKTKPGPAGSGCLDARYEEYDPAYATDGTTKHQEDQCITLIPKDGCRDPDANNFDINVTNHLDNLCDYEPVSIDESHAGPPLKLTIDNNHTLRINGLGRHQIYIYDHMGKLVYKITGADSKQYNLSENKLSGMYIIKITHEGTKIINKHLFI